MTRDATPTEEEGWEANDHGEDLQENPYERHSDEWREWRRGWNNAEDHYQYWED